MANIKTYPKEINWLLKHQDVLRTSIIEQQLNMPANTLYFFLKGERGLNPQWWPSVINWVKEHRKL